MKKIPPDLEVPGRFEGGRYRYFVQGGRVFRVGL